MQTVAQTHTTRKTPIVHYAIYTDLEGTAELVCGSGYLFRCHGEREAILVSYKNPDLLLLGLVALADAQHDADQAAGLVALVQGRAY